MQIPDDSISYHAGCGRFVPEHRAGTCPAGTAGRVAVQNSSSPEEMATGA